MDVQNSKRKPQTTESTEQVSKQPGVEPAGQAGRQPITRPMEQRVRQPSVKPASQPSRKPAAKPASQRSIWAAVRLKYEELKQRARPVLEKAGRQLERVPRWALALSLVAVLVLVILLARSFTRGPAATATSQAATAQGAQAAGLKPLALTTVDAGVANYRQVTIRGLSYANGKLSLLGTVRMPKDRYSDQSWQVSWVSDDVVGKYGLYATDGRIAWYPVTGEYRKEDAESVLATWPVSSDTRCVLHIRLVAKAGSAQESVFAKFDIGGFRPTCIR